MQIVVQKRSWNYNQDPTEEDILTLKQAEFETAAQAKRFLFLMQQKYGQVKNLEEFIPEQGHAILTTEKTQEKEKIYIQYWYVLDGFKGELLNIMTQNIRQSSLKISFRDRKAGVDYNKIAESDAVALEKIVKNLQAYFLSGKQDLQTLETYRSQMMDMALDLNEVISNLENEMGDGLAGLGAGANQRPLGLNRKAEGERGKCKECGKDDVYLIRGKCHECYRNE